jgi:hypothetical protein
MILNGSVLLSLGEQCFCTIWEGTSQRVVTNLAHEEVTEALGWLLAIQLEWVETLLDSSWVVAEQLPVAGSNGTLLNSLYATETALDTMADARCISDDDRWAVVALSLNECLQALVAVAPIAMEAT